MLGCCVTKIFILFQLNIHQFKCFARFGLMHIVATNICVWIRTVFKEGIKDIAAYRVARGEGVSEDFMIKGVQHYYKLSDRCHNGFSQFLQTFSQKEIFHILKFDAVMHLLDYLPTANVSWF